MDNLNSPHHERPGTASNKPFTMNRWIGYTPDMWATGWGTSISIVPVAQACPANLPIHAEQLRFVFVFDRIAGRLIEENYNKGQNITKAEASTLIDKYKGDEKVTEEYINGLGRSPQVSARVRRRIYCFLIFLPLPAKHPRSKLLGTRRPGNTATTT